MNDTGAEIDRLLANYALDGLFSHAYVGLWNLGRPDQIKSFTVAPDARYVFDLASLTKALVTTPLLFWTAKTRGLTLSETVGDWLGADHGGLDSRLLQLRIDHLLAHRSGLPAWRNFWTCRLGVEPGSSDRSQATPQQVVLEGLNRAAADIDPERGSCYSDVGFLLLGMVLEKIFKRPISNTFTEFQEEISQAHPGSDFGYPGPWLSSTKAIPTGWCAVRKRHLMGEVHDENTASLGGACAHAGLFGSGDGTAHYLDALVASPIGQEMWDANKAALCDPDLDPPNEGLLGWRQGADPSSRPFGGGWSMGHMGFTGVAFWCDPTRRKAALVLTNRVWQGRDRKGIADFRAKILSLLDILD